jgi:hypothetical protein
MIAYYIAHEDNNRQYVTVFGHIRHLKKALRSAVGTGRKILKSGRLTVEILSKYNVTHHTLLRVFVGGVLSHNREIERVWHTYRNSYMTIEAVRFEAEGDLEVIKNRAPEWAADNLKKILDNFKRRKKK